MEKYTTETMKVNLNSDMETIENHSIMKNKGQIQNFRRNTKELKNPKHNPKYNFMFQKMSTNKKIGICYLCLKFVLFTKFALFNLAAKLSVVNLLKSGVLIYLS